MYSPCFSTFDAVSRRWPSAACVLAVGVVWLGASGAAGQGLIQLPFLNQTPGDVLEVQIGGTVPITDHDVYQILGDAQLEGRVDLRLINGYTPLVGDTIDFLTAASIEQQFRSHFFPEPLPDEVAVAFLQSPTQVRAAFVSPQLGNDFVGLSPTSFWNDPSNWAFGEVPNSTNVTFIQNNSADSGQRITVAGGPSDGLPPAAVHELFIASDGLPMELEVAGNAHFSASLRATVGGNGRILLSGGSLISNKVIIGPQGRVILDQGQIVSGNASTDVSGLLIGSGQIIGALNVLNGGTLEVDPGTAPGWGALTVLGDYSQSSGGHLALDVQSAVPGDADSMLISGDAALDGVLDLDMTGFTSFNVGTSVDIITAGTIDATARFSSIREFGRTPNGSYAAPEYTTNTVSLVGYSVGDMNRDSIFDSNDVDLFVLALRDREAYELTMLPDGSLIGISADITGDTDYDGDLDFDDIDDMIALLPPPAAIYAMELLLGVSVPEPSSLLLVLLPAALLMARGRWT